MDTVANRIKEGMRIRGFKQADIVERSGINKGALSCYISGKYIPKQNSIYLIAKALDVSESWLMGADVPMDRNPTVITIDAEPLRKAHEKIYEDTAPGLSSVIKMYSIFDEVDRAEILALMEKKMEKYIKVHK